VRNVNAAAVHNPDFYVWHLRFLPERDDGPGTDSICQADLVGAGARQLNEGNAELCSAVAGAAGISVDGVVDWQIERFCSPYYSDHREQADPAAWLVPVWRLEFRFPTPRVSPGYRFAGPVPIIGRDPTWRPGEWLRPTEDIRIIADGIAGNAVPARWASAAAALTERLPWARRHRRTFEFDGGTLDQFEVGFGPSPVVEAGSRIEAALATCEEAGLETWVRRTALAITDLNPARSGAQARPAGAERQDITP
jgi:hypothetical protein